METGLVYGTFSSPSPEQPRNRILASLPVAEFDNIARHLRPAPLRRRHIFQKQGEIVRDVYFPGSGACSLMKVMRDGRSAEVATIGDEGMIGAGVFFGDDVSQGDVIAHVRDPHAVCMPVDAFVEEMSHRNALYNRVVRYSQALATQILQTTACTGLHSAEERYCRWLLMTLDRVGGRDLTLTHDFIAAMLAVRRPTVTLITGKFQRAGLIETHRGRITVIDRVGLEAACCECYGSVHSNFRRLLPELSGLAN